MSNKFKIYSFFVPEFIEAQRTSFLQLLKTDIPTELDKHNPIRLNIQEPEKKRRSYKLEEPKPLFSPNPDWIEHLLPEVDENNPQSEQEKPFEYSRFYAQRNDTQNLQSLNLHLSLRNYTYFAVSKDMTRQKPQFIFHKRASLMRTRTAMV